MRNPLDRLRELMPLRRVAERLEIKPPSVYQWSSIPDERALEIERITSGDITAREVLEYNLLRRRFPDPVDGSKPTPAPAQS